MATTHKERMAPPDPERYRDPSAWPYSFEILSVDVLFVDDRYQRPVTTIADQIAEHFERALLEPLLVSRRKRDRYAIADGQNRWAGAKRIGERWLWCRVMRLTPQEEARIFSALQAQRKNIRPLERFKADVFAGNPEAIAVSALLRRHGVVTSEVSGAYSSEDSLAAITAVRRGWARYGDERMDRVFEIVRAAFPGERGRWVGEVINGLAAFLSRHEKDIDVPRLVAALSNDIGSVRELLARSAAKRRGAGMGGGSQVYTVRVIEDAYRRVGRGPFRREWDRSSEGTSDDDAVAQ